MIRFILSCLAGLLAWTVAAPVAAKTGRVPAIVADHDAKQDWLARAEIRVGAAGKLDLPASAGAAEGEPAGSLGSLGTRRGDMDRHFGRIVDFPGRTLSRFNDGDDLNDRGFGVMAQEDDSSIVIGRAGTLANGVRLGLAWFDAGGRRAQDRLIGGQQTVEVSLGGDLALNFIKARSTQDAVGPALSNRFYVLGQIEFTASSDGDIDFAVLCLRYDGNLFIPCADFGTLGNGMTGIAFDLGGPGFRKDIPYDLHIDMINQKLLLAGAAQLALGSPAGSDYDFAVARLDLFTGALDGSFDGSGKRTIHFDLATTPIDEALAVHVRPLDGKVVLGGRANVGLFVYRSAMAQLNPDGSLDTAFCAPAVGSCLSPASHRAGRRLWQGEETLAFSQVVSLLGGDLFATDTVVVREQVPGENSGRGIVSRLATDGGCSICTEAWLSNFERIRPVAAALDYRFIPPFLFDFGVVVAAYGIYSSSDARYTHVFRVRSSMLEDEAFTTGPISNQQFYAYPTAPGENSASEPAAIALDRRGRYLIAGSRRWSAVGNDWDFALARLQNDVILDDGFDLPTYR